MKRNLVKYGFYLLFIAVIYYLVLPVSIQTQGTPIFLMLVLMPALLLAGSGIWGYFYSFDIICPLMAGLLFIPPVFLFMNGSALIYALIYAIIALAGVSVGGIIRKYRIK